jgi:hypothetical protein
MSKKDYRNPQTQRSSAPRIEKFSTLNTGRFVILVALITTSLIGSGQSRSYRIFDEYAHHDGFTYLSFSKSMIDNVDFNIDDNKKITGDLKEIRIMILNKGKSNFEGSLSKIISGKFDKMNYKRIEPENDEGNKDVEFWIEGDSKKVKECHIIVNDSNDKKFSCLVSFYGNFNVEDLGSLEKFSRKQADK